MSFDVPYCQVKSTSIDVYGEGGIGISLPSLCETWQQEIHDCKNQDKGRVRGEDFSDVTLLTFATFSSSSWSPSSAASLLASRAWGKTNYLLIRFVNSEQAEGSCLPFCSFSPDSLPYCQIKRMFFSSNQILVVLVFVKLSSARKLVQLQLDSAEKLLLKLMPETSNAGLPGAKSQDRGVFSPHDQRHLRALRVHIAWLTV